MKIPARAEYIYGCPIDNINVYFKYNNSSIYSTGKKINLDMNECSEVKIVSECMIEEFNSVYEMPRYCRSEVLVILGIMTFFIGNPMVVYQGVSSHFTKICSKDLEKKDTSTLLKIDGKDYTDQLKKVLVKLETDKSTLTTLLDRWRKANYLVETSMDANLYHDEAILSYFHIIELFAEIQGERFKTKLKKSIEELTYNYYKNNFWYNEKQIDSKFNTVRRVIYEALVEDELTLANKIKSLLEAYELLDNNVSYFLDEMIKKRNAIAHGRITYRKDIIWPVPPFFCLAHDSYDVIENIKFLTAKMISCYIGIECWDNEWQECKIHLLPPPDILSSYLNNPSKFATINVDTLCTSNPENITWETIFAHCIKDPKKFNINRLKAVLKEHFISTVITEENGMNLFNISVIFCDCDDNEIKSKAIENVKLITKKQWYSWSNPKDICSFLEYYQIEIKWYKDYLTNNAHMAWEKVKANAKKQVENSLLKQEKEKSNIFVKITTKVIAPFLKRKKY